jgi:hypothetical protein
MGEQKISKTNPDNSVFVRELNPVIPKYELAAPARWPLHSLTQAVTITLHFAGRTASLRGYFIVD